MNMTKEDFFKEIATKKIGFLGVGVTNYPNIFMFNELGLRVKVIDKKEKEEIEDYELLRDLGVEFSLGEHYLDGLDDCDIVFRAPGFYYNHKKIKDLRKKGKIITSDLEVFLKLCPCSVIGITGSDGKTTTTSIIYEMLKAEGKTVHLGGNIGKNMLSSIFTIKKTDYVVLELSSFQLISMGQSPDISVITNISPNHLDIHGDMDEYVSAKENIFLHQTSFEKSVFNLDNGLTSGYEGKTLGETRMFSRKRIPTHGGYLDEDGYICFKDYTETVRLFHVDSISIPGNHNIENFLAAASALYKIVLPSTMEEVAKSFLGVEHRIELARDENGVRWYNDSIATSPGRTKAGLYSFRDRIILIAGGADKKLPFGPMGLDIVKRVKHLILMGPTGKKIEKAVLETPEYNEKELTITFVDNLKKGVEVAEKAATEGDVVLFSPASTSFDAYKNFEERGKHFKKLVKEL